MIDEVSLGILKRTKLSEKQARVYLAVLQLGPATVGAIAESAALKRSITYVILETLMQQGYVTQLPDQKKKLFAASDPNTIATELDQTAQEFKEMLPYLRSLQRKHNKPYVRYYHGIEGARRAFQQIRRPKEARYAVSIAKAQQVVPSEVERWQKTYERGKGSLNGRHMLTNTPVDRAYGARIQEVGQLVRYLAVGQELDMDLALVDGTVFLSDFSRDIEVTVIESPGLYRSLCALYDVAWQASQAA